MRRRRNFSWRVIFSTFSKVDTVLRRSTFLPCAYSLTSHQTCAGQTEWEKLSTETETMAKRVKNLANSLVEESYVLQSGGGPEAGQWMSSTSQSHSNRTAVMQQSRSDHTAAAQ